MESWMARLEVLDKMLSEFPEVEVYVRLRLDKNFTHDQAVRYIRLYLEEAGIK